MGLDVDPAGISDELADVVTYFFMLAGCLGLDLDGIVLAKFTRLAKEAAEASDRALEGVECEV